MPAKSGKQQRLMGMALSIKRGEQKGKKGSPAAKVAKSLTTKELRKFARKPKKS